MIAVYSETLSDMFEFLDVDNDNKIDFEEFIRLPHSHNIQYHDCVCVHRACGAFVLASEPLEPLSLSKYSHVDHLSKVFTHISSLFLQII